MKTVYFSALTSMALIFWLLLQPENPIQSTAIRVLIGGGLLFLFLYGVMFHHKPQILIILLNILGISTTGLIFEYLLIYGIDINSTVSIVITVSVVVFIVSYVFNMMVRYILN